MNPTCRPRCYSAQASAFADAVALHHRLVNCADSHIRALVKQALQALDDAIRVRRPTAF